MKTKGKRAGAMLGAYVCNHFFLGADFGQRAVRCTGNKVDEKTWSISYTYCHI